MAEQQKGADKDSEKKSGEKKNGNMPLMVIIGIVLILNVLMVGKIYLGGNGGKDAAKPQAKQVEEVGPKMALDEFLVNLTGSSDHYLKVTVALGLKKDETEEKLKDDVAPIRDVIVSVLSSKPAEDLATTEGKERLKLELKDRINKELGSDKIVKVYFTSFATQ